MKKTTKKSAVKATATNALRRSPAFQAGYQDGYAEAWRAAIAWGIVQVAPAGYAPRTVEQARELLRSAAAAARD